MTTNPTANYVARKGITKHLSRHEAVKVWSDLLIEGWVKDRNRLTKDDHTFVFSRISDHKTAINHLNMEVAS